MIRVVLVFLVLLLPSSTLAVCYSNGATIVFVNGILNDEKKARESVDRLIKELERANISDVDVLNGFNPSHLGGVGDLVHSVAQAFGKPISKYDLNTILMQIHSQVTTRKILLVGHSQGTFYTNEMYGYLTTHGVPKESIAVYNIATPASYVAGGGGYITSENDKIINEIRDLEIEGNIRIHADSFYTVGSVISSALRANIAIPREEGYADNKWGGHSFGTYLGGATPRIVGDIKTMLANLKVEKEGTAKGCFEPPREDAAYIAEKILLSAADKSIGALASAKNTALAFAQNLLGSFAARPSAESQLSAAAAAFEDPGDEETPDAVEENTAAHVAESVSDPGEPPPAPPVEEYARGSESGQNAPAPQEQLAGHEPLVPIAPSAGVSISPGFGGGGSPSESETNASSSSAALAAAPESATVPLAILSPEDGASIAGTSVSIVGTTTPSYTVGAEASAAFSTTTADASGNWSFALSLPEGSHQLSFSAYDDAGNHSSTSTLSVFVDITAPASTTASAYECAYSLASGYCLVPASSATLSWSAAAGAASYAVYADGVLLGTTTSMSYSAPLPSNATTTLTVVAYDAAGNSASSTPVAVRQITGSLMINEVGWGTDATYAADQFIEIANSSAHTLDLSHTAILRTGGGSISLAGSISPVSGVAADGYLVLERTDFITSGIHELIVPYDELPAAGDQLTLIWAIGLSTTTLDATPALSTCGGWCAGTSSAQIGSSVQGNNVRIPLSMERISGAANGQTSASWRATDTYGSRPPSGSLHWGTPGIANTSGWKEAGWYCGTDAPIAASVSPGPYYKPSSSSCTYLSSFVSPLADRGGGLYRGDVASSTALTGHLLGKSIARIQTTNIPNPQAGEHFFVAMWEVRAGNFSDSQDFGKYFEGTSATPPHGNYVVIPWVYGP